MPTIHQRNGDKKMSWTVIAELVDVPSTCLNCQRRWRLAMLMIPEVQKEYFSDTMDGLICPQPSHPCRPIFVAEMTCPHSPAYADCCRNWPLNECCVCCCFVAVHHANEFLNERRVGRFIGNRYGGGSRRIWTDNVVCNGNERDIDSCDHSPWGVHDCSHSQDVSVSCVTGMKLIATTQVRACANGVAILKSTTAIWSIRYSL